MFFDLEDDHCGFTEVTREGARCCRVLGNLIKKLDFCLCNNCWKGFKLVSDITLYFRITFPIAWKMVGREEKGKQGVLGMWLYQ